MEFQQRLKEYLARNGSVIEGFNLVWDKMSSQFCLLEREQAEIHWELVQWARSYDLFTGGEQKALAAVVDP